MPFAITELNDTQLFSETFGLTAGKVTTMADKANELARGEGRSQFMNFQLLYPAVFAQVSPYSALAAGAVWMPTEDLRVTTLVMNVTGASTTACWSASASTSCSESGARRSPSEQTVLHQVLADNLETFLDHVAQGDYRTLPRFVERELRACLGCGILTRGFCRCTRW